MLMKLYEVTNQGHIYPTQQPPHLGFIEKFSLLLLASNSAYYYFLTVNCREPPLALLLYCQKELQITWITRGNQSGKVKD